jgi:hypothetical protein
MVITLRSWVRQWRGKGGVKDRVDALRGTLLATRRRDFGGTRGELKIIFGMVD